MLVAYLPEEKLLIEADLYDVYPAGTMIPAEPSQANRSLYNHVQRLHLDVETIVPIHGQPVPWAVFSSLVEEN